MASKNNSKKPTAEKTYQCSRCLKYKPASRMAIIAVVMRTAPRWSGHTCLKCF